MKKRLLLTACVLIATGIAVAVLVARRVSVEGEVQPATIEARISPQEQASAPNALTAPTRSDDQQSAAVPSIDEDQQAQVATEQSPSNVFQLDRSGRLVLNEQTRLNIEALFARTEPGDLPQVKQQVSQALPPVAAAEALDLLDRYDNYQQAQRQTYPPDVAPPTEEAALADLDGLHALRVAHFGPNVAQAFYGEEEALSRSLIELMRLEKDQSLTMEEKAVRALQLRESMPEISEIERRNRQ